MDQRRALVTGAAGFLGSHLTDALLASGCTVIGVDNLSTGNLANLEHLKGESRFSLMERDITEPLDPGLVDYVFNFASPASPADYHRLGVETLLVGSAGTMNTLGPGAEVWGGVSACVDVGVLRGPRGASAGGDILGECEPGGAAVGL